MKVNSIKPLVQIALFLHSGDLRQEMVAVYSQYKVMGLILIVILVP